VEVAFSEKDIFVRDSKSKGDGPILGFTVGIARHAQSVVAFDPDADAVERAKRALPGELAERVAYRVASGKEIELEPHSFDIVVFSWSL